MNLFGELIRVAIGTQKSLTRIPTETEWRELFDVAMKQSLVGVCFVGLHNLGADSDDGFAKIGMSEDLFFDWMGTAVQISIRNEQMDGYTKDALLFFRDKDIPCQVLKGQGVAKLYGNLQGYRQSGDIDVWLAGGRNKVYQLSRDVLGKIVGANYHHIHFPIWDDPEIEAHIYPSFLSSPFRNRQLHQFCKRFEPNACCDDFPQIEFNLVFIMLHCYRHLCGHGVGMRQVMDYYFVLRQAGLNGLDDSKAEALNWCKKLGMGRFVGAMMWVLKEVFGTPDEYLLCESNQKEGEFLLNEIMNTGNMGHGETRFKWGQKSPLGRFVAAQKRNLYLATHYPHEVLWSPLFNLWRFFWLKTKGL